ncbi:hypothetical protein ACFX2B_014176 [Malus domestica]
MGHSPFSCFLHSQTPLTAKESFYSERAHREAYATILHSAHVEPLLQLRASVCLVQHEILELKLSDEDQARGGDRRVVRDSNCADSSSSLLSSSWSDMLPELLGEIIRRVEASEDKGPHRKNVVACACPLPDDGVPRLLLDIGSGSGFRTSFRTSISSSQSLILRLNSISTLKSTRLLPAFSPSNPYGLDQVPWHKDHRWDRNMNFPQFLEFSSCFGSLPRDEWAVLCACAQ